MPPIYPAPRIEVLQEKKLIGQKMSMSIIENKTAQLWRQFAPRIKEIENRVSEDKISMQLYPPLYYEQFHPATEFIKWAAVEVKDYISIPNGMLPFTLSGGLYVVFDYRGSSSDPAIFNYIFSEWLPQSIYDIDDRPHFEVLGPKYKNNDPISEEEIWIPIKERNR